MYIIIGLQTKNLDWIIYKLYISLPRGTTFNVVPVQHYSYVGEISVDQKIKKVERLTADNLPQ